ncbi:MAG: pantoate--beta-alanine ligase [Desulfuromonadia bacterium]
MIRIIEEPAQMQRFAQDRRREGMRIAFVPTMGYLHEGHASLLREGRRRGDCLILSIFVNPTQFGPAEDFSRYPRDRERDLAIARETGVDVIFAPTPETIYPTGFQTFVEVTDLSRPLCGASRPGHFRGVATVVTKLFMICQPDVALFGNKDYQQLAIIRRMVRDLMIPVQIVGMPIVREGDGLAMSSRNSYLSPDERRRACSLVEALRRIVRRYRQGVTDIDLLTREGAAIIQENGGVIDYLEFRDKETLDTVTRADDSTICALAVRIGTTRLIDNCILGEECDL